MTDVQGRLVDFRMTLVVMTSNLGVREHGAPGFSEGDSSSHDVLSAVRAHFRPEFFNRIDHVVPFRRLDPDDLARVVDLELAKLGERVGLRSRRLAIEVAPAARRQLAAAGYGSAPVRSFAERRSYDMVKTNVREVFPRALLQGGAGLVLALLGSRLRRRA